jgi:hypothetical protein
VRADEILGRPGQAAELVGGHGDRAVHMHRSHAK